MEKEDAGHTIAVNPAELEWLSFGQMNNSNDKRKEKQQHTGRAHKAFLLADGAENEVCILLRNELQLGLRAVEEAFALQSSRTDGNLTLMDIVASTGKVVVQAKKTLIRTRW